MTNENCYSRVKSEWGQMGSLSYVSAETQVSGGRHHQRIIANSPLKEALHGKPLFYADTYLVNDELTVYSYSRHKADAYFFFQTLNKFYAEIAKDYELHNKQFHGFFNNNGKLSDRSIYFPFDQWNVLEGLRFVRLALPIGDIAVEFSTAIRTAGNQLEGCFKRKELTRALECPLLGCDLSRTPVLASLMARLHWASDYVSPVILERLAAQLTGDVVPS